VGTEFVYLCIYNLDECINMIVIPSELVQVYFACWDVGCCILHCYNFWSGAVYLFKVALYWLVVIWVMTACGVVRCSNSGDHSPNFHHCQNLKYRYYYVF
jgi:hypothetical protein